MKIEYKILNKILISAIILSILLITLGNASALTPREQLGKFIFTDPDLSNPAGQSCQDCHEPVFAFTDPVKTIAVSEGVILGRFGNRNAPSVAYSGVIPEFGIIAGGEFIGGLFWDGRAQNLTEQAKGPFTNSLEMNNANSADVITKIQAAPYADLFNQLCGTNPDKFTCATEAIAEFERSPEMNKFNSKFDVSFNSLTVQEMRGLALFTSKGQCFICHPEPYFFTDFDYANIGVPSNLGMIGDNINLQNYFPFYYDANFNHDGLNFVDIGLAKNPNVPTILQTVAKGMMKAPTLRNVELTSPYMHNGVFKTLKEVVHFYNTRDVLGNCATTLNPQPGTNCWPSPESTQNINAIIGNLGMSDSEENDIVAFLKTLTDSPNLPVVTTYSVSGIVTESGVPLPGVAILLTGTLEKIAVTDNTGKYTLTGVINGSYTITPSLNGYSFIPLTRNIIVNGADVDLQNFAGTKTVTGFSISGTVISKNKQPLAGVIMTLTPSDKKVITGGDGKFMFTGVINGKYTITPSNGARFNPQSRDVTIKDTNVIVKAFRSRI